MTDPESRGQLGSCLLGPLPLFDLHLPYHIQPPVRYDPEADMSEPKTEEVHQGNASSSCWQNQPKHFGHEEGGIG